MELDTDDENDDQYNPNGALQMPPALPNFAAYFNSNENPVPEPSDNMKLSDMYSNLMDEGDENDQLEPGELPSDEQKSSAYYNVLPDQLRFL
jgi:hypothetical protein